VRDGGHCIVRGGACPAAKTAVCPLYQLISQNLTSLSFSGFFYATDQQIYDVIRDILDLYALKDAGC